MAETDTAIWGEATASVRNRLVMASTAADDTVLYTTGDTVAPVGLLDASGEGYAQGQLVGFPLWYSGGHKPCIASGAITHGAPVAPDAAGKVKAAATGDLVIGMAAGESGANNDEIEVWPTPSYIHP